MFKTKTFNLVQEKENKKFEKLYDPKRCRWMEYIVIPAALIGFALLLVLVIVDVSGDSNPSINENVSSTASPRFFSTTGTTKFPIQTAAPMEYFPCRILNDNCTLDCFGGWLEDLSMELENKQLFCNRGLVVRIRSYKLSGNKLKAQHLTGNFQFDHLYFDSVTNENIAEIEDGAFDTDSFANLRLLSLEDSNVKHLNERTFQGLSIEWLQMTILNRNLDGTNFLQPLASSLSTLILRYTETDIIFDPTNWLHGAYFTTLSYLNLNGNNFNNTLRGETFAMLKAVQMIVLHNCQISSIANGTFDAVAYTLQYLYLDRNQLKTLDMKFLSNIVGILELRLDDNIWDCTCENYQLITACNSDEINCGEPKCTTPEIDKPFSSIELECETTTTDKPTSTSDRTTASLLESTTDTTTDATTDTATDTTTDATTTPNTDQLVSFYCRSTSSSSSEEPNSITVRDYDAYFSFYTETAQNVTLVVKSNMEDLHLIYFVSTNSTYINATNDDLTTTIDSKTTEINVLGLLPDQLYVFCLIPRYELKISPFNCRSYYFKTAHLQKSVWLSKDDLAWFLTIVVIGLILMLGCGLIAMFFLLRWRPTWLYGSKRIIRKGSKSHEVYMKPNKRDDAENIEMGATCGKMDIKTDDYMEFHKDFQNSRENRTLQVGANMSPYEPAPSIPSKSQSRSKFVPTAVCADVEDEEGNYYQSIHYYEELH